VSKLTAADISRIVAGAIKGGLPQGSFAVEVTRAGNVRLLPADQTKRLDEAELDDELKAWRNAQTRKTA